MRRKIQRNILNGPKLGVLVCAGSRPWEVHLCKRIIDQWDFKATTFLSYNVEHPDLNNLDFDYLIKTKENRGQYKGEQDNINHGVALAWMHNCEIVLKCNADTWWLNSPKLRGQMQQFSQAHDKWYWGFDTWGDTRCSTDTFLIKPKHVFENKIFPIRIHGSGFEGEFFEHFSLKGFQDRMWFAKAERERSFSKQWEFVCYHDLEDNFNKMKELGHDNLVKILRGS